VPARPSALRAAALVVAAAAAALTGCGGTGRKAPSATGSRPAAPTLRAAPLSSFAWLRPAAGPAGWLTAQLPSRNASIAYPPSWRTFQTDPGTISVAPAAGGPLVGYLNLTPRQGGETAANFSGFRLAHNREEGDRAVRRLASSVGLRFQGGHGSCVADAYLSRVKANPYREVACFVQGSRASTVVVGAAPPAQWPRQGPIIERAISSVQER